MQYSSDPGDRCGRGGLSTVNTVTPGIRLFHKMKDREERRNKGSSRSVYLWRQAAFDRFRVRHPIMRSNGWLFFLSLLATCASTWNAEAATTSQPGHPATWRPYDLIVDLHDLPQRYSCDDLWYKFRDVLLAMGARPDIKILVYRCERGSPDRDARSPRAQLQFSIPELLTPAQSRWAQLQAVTTTVRLGPGHPASLLSGDCQLLRQMKDGLLESLSQRVVSFNLACTAASHSARWPFDVTVQALTPSRTSLKVVAQAGALSR